jgi:hypothetical protein
LHGGVLQAYLRLATAHQKQEQKPLMVHSVYRYFLPRSRPPVPNGTYLLRHTRPLRHRDRPEVAISALIGR